MLYIDKKAAQFPKAMQKSNNVSTQALMIKKNHLEGTKNCPKSGTQ